jgi:hypothetical protein
LASKQAISPSASTTVVIAMNREASTTSSPRSTISLRNAPWICWIGGSPQKRAASVCSGVRVVLVREPISFTSL